MADDAEIFDLIVNFDVITDIGGAPVLDRLAIARRDRTQAQIRDRVNEKPDELFASSYLQTYESLPEEIVARLFIKTEEDHEDGEDMTAEANALVRLQSTVDSELENARDTIKASGAPVARRIFAKMDSRGPAEMLRQDLTSDRRAIVY